MMCETKQIKKIEKRFVCLQTHLDNDKCIMGHIIQTSQLVISPPPHPFIDITYSSRLCSSKQNPHQNHPSAY